MTNGRFASLSPSKPGGLVRRPSTGKQGSSAGSSTTPVGKNAEKRRSIVNGAGGGAVDAVKSPGELTVFVSRFERFHLSFQLLTWFYCSILQVDKLLSDLEGKFDIMSHDLL